LPLLFHDPPTTLIYTLSLHDALPIFTLARKNIDDLFNAAGRQMTEGLHLAFLKERVDDAGSSAKAKLELFALLQDESVLRHIERSEEQRLNSSHLGISYAVFCLKKKN